MSDLSPAPRYERRATQSSRGRRGIFDPVARASRRDRRPLDARAGAPPAARCERVPGAAPSHRHRAPRALRPAARAREPRLRRDRRAREPVRSTRSPSRAATSSPSWRRSPAGGSQHGLEDLQVDARAVQRDLAPVDPRVAALPPAGGDGARRAWICFEIRLRGGRRRLDRRDRRRSPAAARRVRRARRRPVHGGRQGVVRRRARPGRRARPVEARADDQGRRPAGHGPLLPPDLPSADPKGGSVLNFDFSSNACSPPTASSKR